MLTNTQTFQHGYSAQSQQRWHAGGVVYLPLDKGIAVRAMRLQLHQSQQVLQTQAHCILASTYQATDLIDTVFYLQYHVPHAQFQQPLPLHQVLSFLGVCPLGLALLLSYTPVIMYTVKDESRLECSLRCSVAHLPLKR